MPMTAQDVRKYLLASDPEYQRLAEEHTRCESQLEQIIKSYYLNSEDLLQEAALKRRKLHLKDAMELLVARRQQNAAQ